MNTQSFQLLFCTCATLFFAISSSTCLGQESTNPQQQFEWMFGDWEGVRTSSDGVEKPITIHVESILGGAGLTERIEVKIAEDNIYRGHLIQVFDTTQNRFVRQYVNDSRGRFVRLDGEIKSEDKSHWTSSSPKGISLLESERTEPNRWQRTQSISEDDGQTWKIIFVDKLVRKNESTKR